MSGTNSSSPNLWHFLKTVFWGGATLGGIGLVVGIILDVFRLHIYESSSFFLFSNGLWAGLVLGAVVFMIPSANEDETLGRNGAQTKVVQQRSERTSVVAAPAVTATKFNPPRRIDATQPWATRIVNYAARVARELQNAQVATWPGEDLWLISVDIYDATWHVPVTNRFALERGWMRQGLCSGSALALMKDGTPVNVEFFGHFNFSEPSMSFEYKDSNVDSWATNVWGANNYASWRDKGSFGKQPTATYQEYFDGVWDYKNYDNKPPGLGTSLALKSFLETHKTRLPRYY